LKEEIMGRDCNRNTLKMKRRRRQEKLKARIKARKESGGSNAKKTAE
jgi:hypothetical protein